MILMMNEINNQHYDSYCEAGINQLKSAGLIYTLNVTVHIKICNELN